MAKGKEKRPQTTASVVMSLPQPPLRKSEDYLKAYTGYAFTAISAIAQEVASIQLKLFKRKVVRGVPEGVLLHEHEVLSLLQYVNPLTTFYDLIEATQIYLELTGEAFWVVLKEGSVPREIWMVRPDWVKIVPDKEDVIKHYTYHPGGVYNEKVVIPRDNMIHFRYFNPLNPYRGKGSVQAAALPMDIHTFAQEWNRNFFFNSAIPGLVFTTENRLSKKVVKRFIEQWQANYGGRSKSNKVAFLDQGMKMDKTTMNIKDMDFAEQQRMMRDDVLAVFKVPKTILGLTDDVNRANAEATTRAFMERVVTPRMRKFVGQLNEFLLPMYPDRTLFFDFVDPAPEDVELKLKRYANARRYTWMTPNEIRTEENMEPVEGGDDLFAPLAGGIRSALGAALGGAGEEKPPEEKGVKIFGWTFRREAPKPVKKVEHKRKPFKHMMPMPVKGFEEFEREKFEKAITKDLIKFIGRMLKTKNNDVKEEKPKEKTKENTDETFTDEQKDAYWRTFIDVVTEREEELKEKAIELFKEQERMVIDRLNEDVRYWRKSRRRGKESSVIPSVGELSKVWDVVFLQVVKEIVKEQGDSTLDFLGAGGNLEMTTDQAVEYLRVHGAELVRAINETTRDKLRKALAEGFEAGESIPDLTKRVEEVFKDATRNRATMIARTESLRASNFGSVEAYRQSEVVEAQEWLTERDLRVCPYCLEMDGKVIGLGDKFFDKGDSFTVDGNTIKFDLLAVEYPPLHVSCYSKDTEAYTRDGWKLIKDIKKNEEMLTLEPESRNLEWGRVIGTTSHHEDKMFSLTNRKHSVDMLVSKNHPFFGYKRVDHGKERTVEPVRYDSIKDLPKTEFRFYLSSVWKGDSCDSIGIAGKKFDAFQFVRFMAFYLSEGSVTLRKKGGYQISIAQTRFLDEMWEELRTMPFDKVCLGKDKIYIFDQVVAKYLLKYGKAHEKYIPTGIKKLAPVYLREFLDAYAMGDGSVRKGKEWKGAKFNDSIVLFTSSDKMASDLGEIIIKSGKAVSYQLDKTAGKEQKFRNGTYKINHDCWRIYILNSKHRYFRDLTVEEVDYNDKVYDVEVDKNNTILTRRNGKVIWGSNCRCTTIPILLGEKGKES